MADRDELEAFCRREHPRLVRSLTLYTGDALLAEEFAQDALFSACRRWGELELMRSPAGWLHRVAINNANGYFRRLRAGRCAEHKVAPRPRTSFPTRPPLLRSAPRLADCQRGNAVSSSCASLPTLNVGETASVLAISPEAVRSLTHRAITTLREHGHEFDSLDHGEVSGAS